MVRSKRTPVVVVCGFLRRHAPSRGTLPLDFSPWSPVWYFVVRSSRRTSPPCVAMRRLGDQCHWAPRHGRLLLSLASRRNLPSPFARSTAAWWPRGWLIALRELAPPSSGLTRLDRRHLRHGRLFILKKITARSSSDRNLTTNLHFGGHLNHAW